MSTLALVEDWRPDAITVPLADQQTAIQLMLDLEAAGMVTPVALTITDPSLSYEKAEAVAAFWGSINRRCAWYIGDLMLYCEAVYGQRVGQIAAATGLTESTIQHRMFVCENVPPERRVPGVSFSCHALVARRKPAEQAYWLNEAAKGGWGFLQLKEQLQHANRADQPPLPLDPPPPPDPPLHDTGVNVMLLVDAAEAVLRDARDDDDGYVKVPVESFERLRAAFNGAL